MNAYLVSKDGDQWIVAHTDQQRLNRLWQHAQKQEQLNAMHGMNVQVRVTPIA